MGKHRFRDGGLLAGSVQAFIDLQPGWPEPIQGPEDPGNDKRNQRDPGRWNPDLGPFLVQYCSHERDVQRSHICVALSMNAPPSPGIPTGWIYC